jgi:hypothetical protein
MKFRNSISWKAQDICSWSFQAIYSTEEADTQWAILYRQHQIDGSVLSNYFKYPSGLSSGHTAASYWMFCEQKENKKEWLCDFCRVLVYLNYTYISHIYNYYL